MINQTVNIRLINLRISLIIPFFPLKNEVFCSRLLGGAICSKAVWGNNGTITILNMSLFIIFNDAFWMGILFRRKKYQCIEMLLQIVCFKIVFLYGFFNKNGR